MIGNKSCNLLTQVFRYFSRGRVMFSTLNEKDKLDDLNDAKFWYCKTKKLLFSRFKNYNLQFTYKIKLGPPVTPE